MAFQVSSAWSNAIKQQFRRQGHLSGKLTIVPPGISTGADVESAPTESITSTATMFDDVSGATTPIASFETDRWIGNGTMYLPESVASGNLSTEWWSNTNILPITVTLVFDAIYTVAGLAITWDESTNSYPTEFSITGYDPLGNVVDSTTFTNDSVSNFYSAPLVGITSLDIVITAMSDLNWRPRINEIAFGPVIRLTEDRIKSATLDLRSRMLSSSLPESTITMTLSNYDKFFDPAELTGYSKYLSERQKLEVTWGFDVANKTTEYMQPWTMFLSKWEVPADDPTFTLTATSRLNFMSSTYSKGKYTGNETSLYTLAQTVLENSDILVETTGQEPWELSETLRNFTTTAPLPVDQTNALLQLICNASGCILTTNLENGYVSIVDKSTSVVSTIGTMQQLGDPAFKINDVLKRVYVYLYSYKAESSTSEVFNTELDLNGASAIQVEFNSIVQNAVPTVLNGEILDFTFYAKSGIIIIEPDNVNTPVTISVTGTVVNEYTTKVETYSDLTVQNGITVEINNPLITNSAIANNASNYAIDYYTRRNEIAVPYSGYPELETGDRVALNTNYGNTFGDIEKLALEYNGGFSGNITVREVGET